MSETDASYQPNVGIEQGESTIFIRSAGVMKFYDQDLTGNQLKMLIYGRTQFSVITNSAGVLSVVNLPSLGTIIFSIAAAASNASAWLTSMAGVAGQEMILMMRGAGVVGSVFISLSGVSVVGLQSTDLSSISLQNSVATESMGYLKLVCTDTDEWSVIDRRGQVIERGSS